jgi:hypothetical protein
LVEDSFDEEEAAPLQLSASFSSGYGESYQYDINDLQDVVTSRPSYVKITKTPVQGELVVKKLG